MADTIDYAPRHRVERLVSAGRIVLAGCLCVGLVLDPGELGRHAAAVQAVASAYFGYAVVIGAWFWLATTTPLGLPLVTHVMDMVLFAVLMHLSGGPDNPFFVDFVFVTLCGAIRWHGRGALATGTVALA